MSNSHQRALKYQQQMYQQQAIIDKHMAMAHQAQQQQQRLAAAAQYAAQFPSQYPSYQQHPTSQSSSGVNIVNNINNIYATPPMNGHSPVKPDPVYYTSPEFARPHAPVPLQFQQPHHPPASAVPHKHIMAAKVPSSVSVPMPIPVQIPVAPKTHFTTASSPMLPMTPRDTNSSQYMGSILQTPTSQYDDSHIPSPSVDTPGADQAIYRQIQAQLHAKHGGSNHSPDLSALYSPTTYHSATQPSPMEPVFNRQQLHHQQSAVNIHIENNNTTAYTESSVTLDDLLQGDPVLDELLNFDGEQYHSVSNAPSSDEEFRSYVNMDLLDETRTPFPHRDGEEDEADGESGSNIMGLGIFDSAPTPRGRATTSKAKKSKKPRRKSGSTSAKKQQQLQQNIITTTAPVPHAVLAGRNPVKRLNKTSSSMSLSIQPTSSATTPGRRMSFHECSSTLDFDTKPVSKKTLLKSFKSMTSMIPKGSSPNSKKYSFVFESSSKISKKRSSTNSSSPLANNLRKKSISTSSATTSNSSSPDTTLSKISTTGKVLKSLKNGNFEFPLNTKK